MVQTEQNFENKMLRGYQMREIIGHGGFGDVYRAFQPSVERDVAIKVIRQDFANQPDFIRRFEAEARLVARLEHPHIVPLFDYWRDPEGAYLVMRWLPNNLRRMLREDALDPQETLKVIEEIGQALTVAHHNHVIHRDIKPDNILIDALGNAYLSDFGIAQIGNQIDPDEIGQVAGSIAYMSPEQLRSEDFLSPRCDIYALGLVLYEILTGKHPFEGHDISDMIRSHISEPVPLLPPHLAVVDPIVQTATEKDPEDRYKTANEMADALRRALNPDATQPAIEIDPTSLVNPYKGLYSFEEADAENFFGREQLIDTMIERLQEDEALSNFLAVVGPSGSGKSSVVRAGLIPQLRKGLLTGSSSWYIAEMMPGASPIQGLANALLGVASSPPANLEKRLRELPDGLIQVINEIITDEEDELLLLIDQFEEVFTMVEDDAEREQFLTLLSIAMTAPNPPLRIIITLRADFYDRPLRYENFASLMQNRTQVVLPLSENDLRRAIIRPAEQIGLRVEQGLAEAIIADLRNEPGALPLLQYALTEVYERREGNRLTLRGYRESGGVSGALARRAGEVYESLSEETQHVARQLLLRLVSPGEGTEDTRRRALRSELLRVSHDNTAIETVLQEYGYYRLLTFDVDSKTREPTVELAHEAIIREWDQLRVWLDENRDDLRMQRKLNTALADWNEHNRDDDMLLRGASLIQYESWYEETDLVLTEDEESFVKASIARREYLEQVEAERAAREQALEKASKRRLRALVGVFAVATLISLSLFGLAVLLGQAAEEARIDAEESAEEAQVVAMAASSRIIASEGDLDLAISLANTAASTRQDLPQVQQALYDVLYQAGLQYHLEGHAGPVIDVAISPDYRFVATGGADGQVIIWDANSLNALTALPGTGLPVTALNFAPDGSQLLIAAGRFVESMPQMDDNAIRVLDMTGTEAGQYGDFSDTVQEILFSADGSRLFASTFDGEIVAFDTATQAVLWRDFAGETQIYELALSPDDTRLAASSFTGDVTVWDAETGDLLMTLEHGGINANAVLFMDDTRLFTGSTDNLIRLWDVSGDVPLVARTYTGHTESVLALLLERNGAQLISANLNGTILLHDIDNGEVIRRFTGEGQPIYAMVQNPAVNSLVTVGPAAADSTGAGVWKLDNAAIVTGAMPNIELASASNSLVVIDDSQVILGDDTGQLVQVNPNENSATVLAAFDDIRALRSLALSNDGRFLAAGAGRFDTDSLVLPDNPIVIWDVEANQEMLRLMGHGDTISHLIYTPDDSRLISGSWDNSVRIWDTATGEQITEFATPAHLVLLSPDGQNLLAISQDGRAVVIDMQTLEQLTRYEINTGQGNFVLSGAWHPGGNLITLSLTDGALVALSPLDGAELARFGSQGIQAQLMTFSPDGLRLVTADSDATIRIRDTQTGNILETRTGHQGQINNLVMTDNGTFATTATDGDVIIWRLDTSIEDLMAWAGENRTIRALTCAERDEYNIEPLCGTEGEIVAFPSLEREVLELGAHRGSFDLGAGEIWFYEGTSGEVLTLRSAADTPASGEDNLERRRELGMLDTRMVLYAPDGTQLAENDDISQGTTTDSEIREITLPEDGRYSIEIRSFGDGTGGEYTLFIGNAAQPVPTGTPTQ